MTFCVFCGAALADTHRCHQCGAYKVGDTWQEGAGPAAEPIQLSGGWRPDPTGRHEGRYYAGGQPTDLVRDGGIEANDETGKQQLLGLSTVASAVESVDVLSPPGRSRRTWTLISAAVLTVLVGFAAAVAAVWYLDRGRESVDDKYLAAVREAGLTGEFNSNANAVAHGKQVCRTLEEGGPQQGMPVDQVAVQFYCPQFSEGFHVLETALITGSFTLNDDSPSYAAPSIEVSGSSCTGTGGYSDVHPGTQVTVTNGKGDVLSTTVLEPGVGGRFSCTLPFTFEATEGEDRYIVSVARRGELSFSFAELKGGVVLTLGDR